MFLAIVARSAVAAVIGYFVGLLLTRVTFQIDQYRLKRKQARFDKQLNKILA